MIRKLKINKFSAILVLALCSSCVILAYRCVRNNIYYKKDVYITSGGYELNVSELDIDELRNDKSPEAALKLHHYYRAVAEDFKLAEKWRKEYDRRNNLIEILKSQQK